jgi:DUF971 family protein
MTSSTPWPTEIRLGRDRRSLTVRFDDAVEHTIPAEMLRVMSPSAEVQGHSADQRVTVPGKRMVNITAVDPVGNYAVRLTFDDGHNTGIFTWGYLRRLGDDRDRLWRQYLDKLEGKKLSREPAS